MSEDSKSKLKLLKQPVDKRYLSVEENLELLKTVPVPKDEPSGEEPSPQDANVSLDLGDRLIDLNPADNVSIREQSEWIDYFNNRNEIMVSMPDLYLAGKSNNSHLLNILQRGFVEITSTRIIYDEKGLLGQSYLRGDIIHYYGSKVIKPIIAGPVNIPPYEGVNINQVISTRDGLIYLHALFNTNDDPNEMKTTLQNLSKHGVSSTKIWTPAMNERTAEKVFCVSCADGFFHAGDHISNISGLARRIRIRKTAKENGSAK